MPADNNSNDIIKLSYANNNDYNVHNTLLAQHIVVLLSKLSSSLLQINNWLTTAVCTIPGLWNLWNPICFSLVYWPAGRSLHAAKHRTHAPVLSPAVTAVHALCVNFRAKSCLYTRILPAKRARSATYRRRLLVTRSPLVMDGPASLDNQRGTSTSSRSRLPSYVSTSYQNHSKSTVLHVNQRRTSPIVTILLKAFFILYLTLTFDLHGIAPVYAFFLAQFNTGASIWIFPFTSPLVLSSHIIRRGRKRKRMEIEGEPSISILFLSFLLPSPLPSLPFSASRVLRAHKRAEVLSSQHPPRRLPKAFWCISVLNVAFGEASTATAADGNLLSDSHKMVTLYASNFSKDNGIMGFRNIPTPLVVVKFSPPPGQNRDSVPAVHLCKTSLI